MAKEIDLGFRAKKLVEDGKRFEKHITDASRKLNKANTKGTSGSKSAGSKSGKSGFTQAATSGMFSIGAVGAAAGLFVLGKAMTSVSSKFLTLGASLESTRMSMTTLMRGDSVGANALIEDIDDMANHTSFMNDELMRGGKVLLGFGVGAKNVRTELGMLGDISAGTGADLDRLVRAYGKGKGRKVITREVLDMFTERGVPLMDAMAASSDRWTGANATTDMMKDITKGTVTFEEMRAGLQALTGEGGMFYGMMAKQAETFEGRLSTTKGLFDTIFARGGEAGASGLAIELNEVNTGLQLILDSESSMGGISNIFESWATAWGKMASSSAIFFAEMIGGGAKRNFISEKFLGEKEDNKKKLSKKERMTASDLAIDKSFERTISGLERESKYARGSKARGDAKGMLETSIAQREKEKLAARKKILSEGKDLFGEGKGGGLTSSDGKIVNGKSVSKAVKTTAGNVVGHKQTHINITLDNLIGEYNAKSSSEMGNQAETRDMTVETLLQVLNQANRIAT